ncbi:MAG: hypothetical protein K2R98_24785 [Gemmataceae bacterium]|nr:hypothetical protein [Gemmataceae bacterium]
MPFFSAEPALLLPIVATAAIVLVFYLAMARRRGTLNVLEIGSVYLGTVALYTVFPLLGFMWNYYSPNLAHDNRIVRPQPSDGELALIGWYCVVHLLSFAVVYVIASGRTPIAVPKFTKLSKTVLPGAVFLYIAITAFLFLVDVIYELSPESYSETYLVTNRLPTALGQCYRVLRDSRYVLEIVVLVVLGRNWRTTYPLIIGWVGGIIVLTYIQAGQRTTMMLLLLAVGMTYQYLVRPLRLWQVVIGGVFTLCLFEIAGIVRSESVQPVADLQFDAFGHHSEFESIFANAYDVYVLKESGQIPELPWHWHVSDFISLIPPQLLPFENTSKALWYLRTFYPEYAASGGGLCFGVVPESILGWGWVDLVWRGMVIGILLSLAQRYWAAHQNSFWAFVFYIWLTISCYWLFRWTTFVLLPFWFYRFLPVYCALKLLVALVDRLGRHAVEADDSEPTRPVRRQVEAPPTDEMVRG